MSLPEYRPALARVPTRLSVRRANVQFRVPEFHTDVLKRLVFSAMVVYNLLPQEVVDKSSVKAFQSCLQKALARAAASGIQNWQELSSQTVKPVRATQFQELFVV